MEFIRDLATVTLADIALVGGKNAALGQMIKLLGRHAQVPGGFAITTAAYRHFLAYNHLEKRMAHLLSAAQAGADTRTFERASTRIRALIEAQPWPPDLAHAITQAYAQLSKKEKTRACAVAIRSSATAEDLPSASFAGQQESFLNISGEPDVLDACKRCFSSLFTPRALIYRTLHNIAHESVSISVGVQRMVRADIGSAGVAFTLDPETGFRNVVCINGVWGLGEPLVQGTADPDTWYVDKGRLQAGYESIISRRMGGKRVRMVIDQHGKTRTKSTPKNLRASFCLTDKHVCELAHTCLNIAHVMKQPSIDIEWAVDGRDGKLWIVQARPETVHTHVQKPVCHRYHMAQKPPTPLCTGQAIGQAIVNGRARIVKHYSEHIRLEPGDILVAPMTNPDWLPLMRQAAGIITDHGGRTCHAAIVSRELGIPACVGTQTATHVIQEGQSITLDCSSAREAHVYSGACAFAIDDLAIRSNNTVAKNIFINLSSADQAFVLAPLPIGGVGLVRTEFIIAQRMGAHPLAYTGYKIPKRLARSIDSQAHAAGYKNPRDFFVHTLAQEMATIASAFWPRPVIVRFSDFKTAEYRQLGGGRLFEPCEPNPMLGLRGAARYLSAQYQPAFQLECAAMAMARTQLGFTNIEGMIPFVRNFDEARAVEQLIKQNGLMRGRDAFKLIMMVETPANALELEQFCPLFDGFSIGSNDLTQLTLAVDRDNPIGTQINDEQRPAVKHLIRHTIETAHAHKKIIGLCGQAPSDVPGFAPWLTRQKIDYISFNVDAALAQLAHKKHSTHR